VNGKVSTWYVETKGDSFRTVSGYLDGEKVTSAWTKCFPKNEGKKNATTASEQAVAEADALYEKRKATGYWENIDDIDTSVYFEPMLAHKWDKYKDKITYPIASQKKYDGVRCIIHSKGMFSRNGKQILSAPHILKSLESLFEQYPDLILDGELYTDKEFDFNKIISCVRKTKPEKNDLLESEKYIKYFIYDLFNDKSYKQRYEMLKEMFNNKLFPDTCVMSEIDLIYNEQEVQKYHDKYVSEGFEGQILRILEGKYENKRSKFLLKNKVFDDSEFTIIGYEEGKGNLSSKLGKLKFEINGNPFDAAVNGGWDHITELWNRRDELIGKLATVRYFGLTTTDKPVPRFPKVIQVDRWDL
jgi:DNA ligase-1